LSISTTSIRRPVSVAMFYIGIAMLGIYAFSKLGVDLLPNVVLPHLMVQTTYNNATPEEIEKLVTEPLESAIGTIPGVKDIKSVSKEGVSIISIDFVWRTDIYIEKRGRFNSTEKVKIKKTLHSIMIRTHEYLI